MYALRSLWVLTSITSQLLLLLWFDTSSRSSSILDTRSNCRYPHPSDPCLNPSSLNQFQSKKKPSPKKTWWIFMNIINSIHLNTSQFHPICSTFLPLKGEVVPLQRWCRSWPGTVKAGSAAFLALPLSCAIRCYSWKKTQLNFIGRYIEWDT